MNRKVKCINNDSWKHLLTVGKDYTVTYDEGLPYIWVRCDDGMERAFFSDRFEEYAVIEDASVNTTYLGTNPKDLQGAKKVSLSLVPASSLIYQASAMEDGAKKYGSYNWRENKVIASIYIDAAIRHLQCWFDSREEVAADSQKPHLGHALACIGILVDAYETGNLVDNRPPAGNASALLDKFKKTDEGK